MAARTDPSTAPGAAPSAAAPLPPGWTQHTAPSGHVYYYNAQTKESTYRRPTALPPPPPPPPPPPTLAGPSGPLLPSAAHGVPVLPPGGGVPGPAPFLRLSDPRVANAFLAQQNAAAARASGGPVQGHGGGRGQPPNSRPRPQPVDKPRSRVAIPGHEPWVLVYTKYGRRFVHNPVKNTSFWRIPEKLLPAIVELDKERLRQRSAAPAAADAAGKDDAAGKPAGEPSAEPAKQDNEGGDDSEYEEVEVWEDVDGRPVDGPDGGRSAKRRKTDGSGGEQEEDATAEGGQAEDAQEEDDYDDYEAHGPVEFSEADIAFQLQAAAAAEDGLDDGYYDDGAAAGEGAGEGAAGTDDGAAADPVAVFQSLLDDRGVNPFGAWDTLVEEGTLVDDARYTALHSMKARRAAWEDWSRARIRAARAAKAEAPRRDPRLAYLQLLQAHATPRLYWPEFKRKHRRDPALKDPALPDRDKERWYREFVARRRLPPATQKADLAALLRSLPPAVLHRDTDPADLPLPLTTDMRYVAVDPAVRDPLVAAYLQTAGPPPG